MDILLVDDHALFRDGVTLVLQNLGQQTGERIRVITAEDAPTAFEMAEQHPDLDLVLLDYNIPGNEGYGTLLSLRDLLPATPIAILSGEEDAQLIEQGLQHGATGFITKSSSSDVIRSAIQLILAGGLYVPPAILQKQRNPAARDLAANVETGTQAARAHTVAVDAASDGAGDKAVYKTALTKRQTEVLFLMDKGLSNKEIARALAMSPSTVKVHVAAILRECEAANRTQAVSFARQQGLLPDSID